MTVAFSTANFYDRATSSFSTLMGKADALNTQVATGRKLQTASDDALAWTRLGNLTRVGADDSAYTGNLNVAAGVLQSADTALTSVTTQLQAASELVMRAANGTMNPADRKLAGDQLASIAESIAGLMNGQDGRGQPLFGGADGGAAVTLSGGRYTLAATAPSAIPIGEGQSVSANESASRVLGFKGKDGSDTDALALLGTLAGALQSGAEVPANGLDDLTAATTQVTDVQASLGARGARVDLVLAQNADIATDRSAEQGRLEGSTADDMAAAITELQKTMTVLQATQASFSKLSGLSLFDYLR
jgi:flagellar hook-associated protein 3 FlgL